MSDSPPPGGVTVRPMRAADSAQVLAVYQAGPDTGDASFETTAPTWDDFDAAKLPDHRHVAVDTASGEIAGWVAVSAVSSRRVYAGVVEVPRRRDEGAHRAPPRPVARRRPAGTPRTVIKVRGRRRAP